jgi:peptide/nickel transport system permease protein
MTSDRPTTDHTHSPRRAIWPGVSIFPLVHSLNLLGDGLRDALDPRQR